MKQKKNRADKFLFARTWQPHICTCVCANDTKRFTTFSVRWLCNEMKKVEIDKKQANVSHIIRQFGLDGKETDGKISIQLSSLYFFPFVLLCFSYLLALRNPYLLKTIFIYLCNDWGCVVSSLQYYGIVSLSLCCCSIFDSFVSFQFIQYDFRFLVCFSLWVTVTKCH